MCLMTLLAIFMFVHPLAQSIAKILKYSWTGKVAKREFNFRLVLNLSSLFTFHMKKKWMWLMSMLPIMMAKSRFPHHFGKWPWPQTSCSIEFCIEQFECIWYTMVASCWLEAVHLVQKQPISYKTLALYSDYRTAAGSCENTKFLQSPMQTIMVYPLTS